MKRLFLPVLLALGALTLGAKAPKDPVLMTVDGVDVPLSEFEYFYHKNDGNELDHETPEQYLQRFIEYKLKVAQARHERQDTTSDFRKDFRQYRREAAKPYIGDTLVEKEILDRAYRHTLSEVRIQHLMIPTEKRALADSLRAILAADPTRWEEIASKYSVDPTARENRGNYGWVLATQYPYEFEDAVYETPVGEVSEVFASPVALHVVRPLETRPNIGEIHGAHILIQPKEGRDSLQAKALIDSIYGLLKQNYSFEELAKKFSDCPSGPRGGDLEWFNRGRMIPEFDDVIFALDNHQFSEPFKTRFGWHIAKKYESRMPSRAQAESMLKDLIARDARSVAPRKARAERLKAEYNTHIDQAGRDFMLNSVRNLGYDSTLVVLRNNPTPLFYVGDSTITVGDFLASNYRLNPRQPEDFQLSNRLDERLTSATLVYEDHRLEAKYPEFRRQSNEYRDGLMLLASMEKNVWSRPAESPEELDAYFRMNQEKYRYPEPRWKGYVLYSTSDSIIAGVSDYLTRMNPAPEVLGDSIKANFPKNVRIERVVLPRGHNEIVDYVAFGGPKPAINGRWKYYVTYMGHIIEGPEEVADTRTAVTNDFTDYLERQYVDELRKKYDVKVNKKVLKQVK